MYLGIRTDSPEASFYLYKGDQIVGQKSWQADRELAKDLLSEIEAFLAQYNQKFETLAGLFIFKGPGSFTGLRIGVTVMNTLAYGLLIPIVGETGEKWAEMSIKRLEKGHNESVILPFYGADPRITKPIK